MVCVRACVRACVRVRVCVHALFCHYAEVTEIDPLVPMNGMPGDPGDMQSDPASMVPGSMGGNGAGAGGGSDGMGVVGFDPVVDKIRVIVQHGSLSVIDFMADLQPSNVTGSGEGFNAQQFNITLAVRSGNSSRTHLRFDGDDLVATFPRLTVRLRPHKAGHMTMSMQGQKTVAMQLIVGTLKCF